MKPIDVLVDPPCYPVRLMIRDACILLTPTIVMLIAILWIYRDLWDSIWLVHFLGSFLPFY